MGADVPANPDLEPTDIAMVTPYDMQPEPPPIVSAFTAEINPPSYKPKDGTELGTAVANVSYATAFNINSKLGATPPDQYVTFTFGENSGSPDQTYPILDVKGKDLYLDMCVFSVDLRIENVAADAVAAATAAGGFMIRAGVIQEEMAASPKSQVDDIGVMAKQHSLEHDSPSMR